MNIKNFVEQIKAIAKSGTVKSISILMSANAISAAAGFIGSIVVLRNCSDQVLGIIYPLIGVLMIANQFSDLGISPSYIKLASQEPENKPRYDKTVFILKLCLCLIVLIGGLLLSPLIHGRLFPDTIVSVNWTYLAFIFTSFAIFSTFFLSKLQIENKFKPLSVCRSVPNIFKLFFLLALYFTDNLTLPLVFAAFFSVPLLNFIVSFSVSSHSYLKEKFSKPLSLKVYSFSRWIFVSSIVNTVLGYTDVLMVRSMAGETVLAHLLGGQKLASIFPIVSSALSQVLLPKVSAMASKKELNYFIRKSFMILAPIILVSLCFLPFSGYLIKFVLGTKYIPSIEIFNVYTMGFLISLLVTPISLFMYRINGEKYLTLMNIFQLVINIVLNYVFIPKYGAVAAAASTASIKVFAIFFIGYFIFKEGILKKEKEG